MAEPPTLPLTEAHGCGEALSLPAPGDEEAREEGEPAEGDAPLLPVGGAAEGLPVGDAAPLEEGVPLSQLRVGDAVPAGEDVAAALDAALALPQLPVDVPEAPPLTVGAALPVPHGVGAADSLKGADALPHGEGAADPVATDAEGREELAGEAVAGAEAEPLRESAAESEGAKEALWVGLPN